jgi:glycerophosphoryl diester phosphodiesterase
MRDGYVSPERLIRRRVVLGAGLAAVAAGAIGCTPKPPPPPATVAGLISATPFYIAHRGGGDNWPEMTAYAYDQAVKLPGLQALEISVCLSADGVLVCSHDATTKRMTGVDYTIAEQTWAKLSELRATSAYTLDPTQPSQPFSRFDDVVGHIDRFVLFVEPKTAAAVEPLMAKMVALNQPERVVWKQPINQLNFQLAKSHGFTTWGYVLDEPGHQGDRLTQFAASPDIDMLGAQRSQPDSQLTPVTQAAANNGKKTIIWNIRSAEDRARGLRLGCQGMMTSNIAEVPKLPL